MTKNLNVPINSKVLDDFKTNCNKYGLSMKTTIEALMKYFNSCNNVEINLNQSGATILRFDNSVEKLNKTNSNG